MWLFDRRTIKLKAVSPPSVAYASSAPPPLVVTPDANHYVCGHCGTVLMIADDHEVNGVIVRCRECGRYDRA
jgi:predicted Zn finger-like uncharacterized protein